MSAAQTPAASHPEHPAYQLIARHDLADYNGRGYWYRHLRSGAEVFHLANDDAENMCAYAFKTLPPDSTGVAHIIEHTVLSGSERFPLKDPFLHLLKGSVNTFLNAMTYPDKTIYPVASPVEEDLFNLMLVYGDAVFFPLLKRELFAQEGHRLQLTADGKLELTGVVYNEMKGNYSSHDSIAGEWCYRTLMPETVYRHDSGGDPAIIPQLTYEQFVAFHRRYYHPSNARIVLYGNIPTERYLSFLDQNFLCRFEARPMDEPIAPQPRWDTPRQVEATYPIDAEDDPAEKCSVTLNWLLFPVTDSVRLLATMVLAEILLGHSGSPLQQALLESELGQDLSPIFGLEADFYESVFSAGLRGTEAELAPQIEQLIFATLRQLSEAGIDADLREAALRRVEFRNRELKSGPNGLRVMGRALRTWVYGGTPDAGLRFSQAWDALQAQLAAQPRYFEQLIAELLLDNPHRTTVILRPKPNQLVEEGQALAAELASRRAAMSAAELAAVERAQQQLETLQQTPDPPEVVERIPTLNLSHIPREVTRIVSTVHEGPAGVPVYTHPMPTNGITYLDLAFDIGVLTAEEEALLHVLAALATEVGLEGLSYDRFSTEVALRTGGLYVSVGAQTVPEHPSRLRRLLLMNTKALDTHLDEAIDLVRRLLSTLTFTDTRRVGIVLDEMIQDMTASLIPSGHSHAMMRSARGLAGSAAFDERLSGVSQLLLLRQLRAEELGPRLLSLWRRLVAANTLTINLTAAPETIHRAQALVGALISACPGAAGPRGRSLSAAAALDRAAIEAAVVADAPQFEYLLTSAGVSFVAQSVPGAHLFDQHYAAQDVLAHLMRTGSLWERIRMQGGAYGAFAQSRPIDAIFTLASYRDPHTGRTLEAFRAALQDAASEPVGARELELAQIAILGREMRPMVPRELGMTAFRRALFGLNDEVRQRIRDDYRAVTPQAVQNAAAMLLDNLTGGGYVAIVGGREALGALEREFPARYQVVSTGV